MKLLLDTCSFLWAMHEPMKLSQKVRTALLSPSYSVHVSVITFWEISLKFGLGKLELKGVSPEDYPALTAQAGWEVHPFTSHLAASAGRLPHIPSHRDPFDRILIWTAIQDGFTLVSCDSALPGYSEQGLTIYW